MYVSGVKNSVFGKFGVLYFLATPVLRFARLPYRRRTDGRGRHGNIETAATLLTKNNVALNLIKRRSDFFILEKLSK